MNRNLIIRLIDVVLIILFGFLAISDIQVKRQIRLPGAPEQENGKDEQERKFILVSIDVNKYYTVSLEKQPVIVTENLEDLRTALIETSRMVTLEKQIPVVIINPSDDAVIQTTINVFDICEQEGLAKSINTKPVTL